MESFVVITGLSFISNFFFGYLFVYKPLFLSPNLKEAENKRPYLTIATIGVFGSLLTLTVFYLQESKQLFLQELLLMHILYWVSITDLKHKIIPNRILLVGLIGLLFVVLLNPEEYQYYNLVMALIVGLLGLALNLFSQFIFKSQGFGAGDIKLLILIAAFVGLDVGLVFFVAVIIAGIVSFILLFANKITRKSKISFVPFILFSFLILENIYANRLIKDLIFI